MKKCALSVVLACVLISTNAQNNYKVHSMYLFSFTRHIIWPDAYNQGDFDIVVLGESPIIQELQDLSSKKKVGDRSIKVTKINAVSEIKKCHILFVPAAQSAQLAAVIAKTGTQSVLVVTEEPGLGLKGSAINFVMKDGKLVFELNQAAAAKHNLKVSNMLTTLAILI